jgi:hypothetical protein
VVDVDALGLDAEGLEGIASAVRSWASVERRA